MQDDSLETPATAASAVPEAADMPLPLSYVVANDAKRPLPGVQSVFLTGNHLLGLGTILDGLLQLLNVL